MAAMSEDFAEAAATAVAAERQRIRARGRRTIWSSFVTLGLAVVFSNQGASAEHEFSKSVLSDPIAIRIYGQPWFASGQGFYFIAGVLFVGAVIGLLVGVVRIIGNPKP